MADMTEPPEVGFQPRGNGGVEVYRSIHGKYSWRVVAVARNSSEDALRDAKALALDIEHEIHADLAERARQRRTPS